MKLLFDENLAPVLVSALADIYPGSVHVRDVGLRSSTDRSIWDYARAGGFTIVSKDADFYRRSFVQGHPPKVIWIALCNCTTTRIATVLRDRSDAVRAFLTAAYESFLRLG